MRKSQRGVTVLGWVVLLIPVAIIGYAGIRVAPIYMNYFKVVKALEQTASEAKGETVNPVDVHNSLERRFNVEYVDDSGRQGHRRAPRRRALGGDCEVRRSGAAVRQPVAADGI